MPVFGVSLELAVLRSRCHDGIDLPVVVRNCIDYIEEFGSITFYFLILKSSNVLFNIFFLGLQQEGIYRSSGVKTRVAELRRAYNNPENVSMVDIDLPVVASLLKQFLR